MPSRARPMRVLYVHHRPEVAGARKSLALLIEALGDSVQPAVLMPSGRGAQLFREAGVEVITGPTFAFSHVVHSAYSGLRWAALAPQAARLLPHLVALERALQRVGPDIVHVNDSLLIGAGWWSARRGVPTVWHLRTSLAPPGRLRHVAIRRALGLASARIAINSDVAASFAPVPSTVIFNPVRLPAVSRAAPSREAKAALGLEPDAVVIGMLSNLYESKGYADLVVAGGILRRRGHAVQVCIVGDPVRSADWHRSARGRITRRILGTTDPEMEIERAIRWVPLGTVHRVGHTEDTSRIYEALDVVCSPSRGPELARPLLEGQAHSRPVVATGSREGAGIVIDGVTGVLAPPTDPDGLARAIEPLVSDASLRTTMGENARRHAERHFSGPAAARSVLDLYGAVLSPGDGYRRRYRAFAGTQD